MLNPLAVGVPVVLPPNGRDPSSVGLEVPKTGFSVEFAGVVENKEL